jgi:hypothetical protein
VRQAAQRGGVEPGPGHAGRGGDVGPRWRRVARSTRASSGASSHCRTGHGVSVQGRGWSCGHAGSPRRSAITRKMATSSAPGSSGAGVCRAGWRRSGPRWRRVARSTRASSGASSHCRPGHNGDEECFSVPISIYSPWEKFPHLHTRRGEKSLHPHILKVSLRTSFF